MTNTKTMAKSNHYYIKALSTLVAVLAVLVAMLLAPAAKPARAETTTFIVNLPTDVADDNSSDGLCDVAPLPDGSQCTLRAAIQQANATPEADLIHFDIPEVFCDPNTGVATISPWSALPIITHPVTIDGYTQPGASPNTATKGTNAQLKIVLSGASAPLGQGMNGLDVSGGGTTIRGLVIQGFKENSTGTGGVGIKLLNVTGNTNNVISGNFIGTNAQGTAAVPNHLAGVAAFFKSINNTIGGTAPADRNLISGNFANGVELGSNGNVVQNNLIGTDKSGTKAVANSSNGVAVSGSVNFIGGASPNTIAFNKFDGVLVDDSDSFADRILSNSIFSNGFLGIDLRGGVEDSAGKTANDQGDADTGPNFLQNKPVISSARSTSTATTVQGKLNSDAAGNAPYVVQFFSNPAGGDEGKKLIGQKTVTTDASGNATFTFKPKKRVGERHTITATATRDSFGIPTDTSEFSAPRTVVSA